MTKNQSTDIIGIVLAIQLVFFAQLLQYPVVESTGSLRRGRSSSNPHALLSELQQFRCTCTSCDDAALNMMSNGVTCGNRIDYLMQNEYMFYPTEMDACIRVASVEFPKECDSCNPIMCDGRVPPPEPANYCGCSSCTPEIYEALTPDPISPVSCGARITWLMSHNGLSEQDSCSIVSQQFPTICGPMCYPGICDNKNNIDADETEVPVPIPVKKLIMPTKTGVGIPVFVISSSGTNQDVIKETIASVDENDDIKETFSPTTSPTAISSTVTSPLMEPTSTITPRTVEPGTNPTSKVTYVDPTIEFGPNTIIIDPNSWTVSQIQELFDDIYKKQVNNEMGTERYSILFTPGTYGSTTEPLMLKIGYYTELSGVGISPDDVTIYGKIEVYNRCFAADPYGNGKFIPTAADDINGSLCFALNNFWRGISNVAIYIVSINQDPCRSRAMFWAISQASSMRRVHIQGGEVSLMDYCSEPGFASGGYIADSRTEKVFNGGQQQFLARNLDISEWEGGVWNQVFLGVHGAPDDSTFPDPPFTTIVKNPISREKPYLYIDKTDGKYYIRVPSVVMESSGVTWGSGEATPGKSIVISDFFIVNKSHSISQINEALATGKNLLFTPGVYDVKETIFVRKANTIILGIGLATLSATNGALSMQIADVPGVVVAGLMFDAGTVQSDVLLQVGPRKPSWTGGDPENPTTLHDIYFRVGGPHIGKADVCLEINSNHVLIDHTWVWRADHGIEGFNPTDGFDGDNQRWKTNMGRNGVVVNGNNVTAVGLFVEHYQQYNVIWNGQGGRVYFFQNELPYDPPSQAEWMTPDGTLGWAGYKVSEDVTSHELWGGGVYSYNRNNPNIVTQNGFEVPNNAAEGIKIYRTFTRNLSGPGTILAVINGLGKTVDSNDKGPSYVMEL